MPNCSKLTAVCGNLAQLTTAVLDITANRMRQSRTGSYRPDVDEDDQVCIEVDFNYPAREPMSRPVVEPSWAFAALAHGYWRASLRNRGQRTDFVEKELEEQSAT